MQFSPGMAVLHSRDLVSWEICSHVVGDLTQISADLNWNRMDQYGRGIWAGSIRWHRGRFYVVFGTPDNGYFISSSKKAEGPWSPLHCLLAEDGWDDCCIDWDEKGQPWFVGTCFKDGYSTYIMKMSKNLKKLDMALRVMVNQNMHREANKLIEHEGWHYLIYSEHTNTLICLTIGRSTGKTNLKKLDKTEQDTLHPSSSVISPVNDDLHGSGSYLLIYRFPPNSRTKFRQMAEY